MSSEHITAFANLATVVIISVSAIIAVVHLQHVRASNELEAVLALQQDFKSPEVQASLHYVQEQLPLRLQDKRYRDELAAVGFVNVERHPELVACNWFMQMGTFLKHGLITESTMMDLYARLIRYYWRALSPVVAIMRRNRGAGQYSDFEYLALRANMWLERYDRGVMPKAASRGELSDPWRDADASEDPVVIGSGRFSH